MEPKKEREGIFNLEVESPPDYQLSDNEIKVVAVFTKK